MARILVLNVFDLDQARADVDAGRTPDQILYGINHFERRGHTVRVVPFRSSDWLKRASRMIRRSPIPLGDLDQQRTVLREARHADLIYCPTQMVSQLLAYLRSARILARPLVWVVHHPLDHGRLRRPRRPLMRAMLGGVDAYPALTAPVADDLAAIAGTAERTGALKWGPDPEWYPRDGGVGRGVIAAGVSNRDFDTFARAVGQTDVPAWIVCSERHQPRCTVGSNTELIADGVPRPHAELAGLYARARAIAIPLHVRWPPNMNGLTSVTDAMGMGKPIIATRNPWLDIDIERLGIGVWVAPGDVAGWHAAIQHLDENPEVAVQMGRRARALVDSGEYSSRTFADRLMDVFDRVLARA